ncbi:MAG: hypothetical protein ACI8RZ_004800 [Myxococcota bacterium]|jgi:hypothetical protein
MRVISFDEMVDTFDRLASGGIAAGIQQVGGDIGAEMVRQAQGNAVSFMTPRTFALHDSIRFDAEQLPAGVEISLVAGGTLDSAHAVYQEFGWEYTDAQGSPATNPGTLYLRTAFDEGLRPVENALLDFLHAALT